MFSGVIRLGPGPGGSGPNHGTELRIKPARSAGRGKIYVAVGQNQWYHFGVGALRVRAFDPWPRHRSRQVLCVAMCLLFLFVFFSGLLALFIFSGGAKNKSTVVGLVILRMFVGFLVLEHTLIEHRSRVTQPSKQGTLEHNAWQASERGVKICPNPLTPYRTYTTGVSLVEAVLIFVVLKGNHSGRIVFVFLGGVS